MKRDIVKLETEKSKGKARGLCFEEHDIKEMLWHLSNFAGYAMVKAMEKASVDEIYKTNSWGKIVADV